MRCVGLVPGSRTAHIKCVLMEFEGTNEPLSNDKSLTYL